MKFLATLLGLGGYTLVYAAVADGGRFAPNPWMGLYRDAYGAGETTPTSEGGSGASGVTGSTKASGGVGGIVSGATKVSGSVASKIGGVLTWIGNIVGAG